MLRNWVFLVLFLPVFAQALNIERSILRAPANANLLLEDAMASDQWQSVDAFGTHGFTSDIFWLKLSFSSNAPSDVIVKLVYPIHDYVDFYHVQTGSLQQHWAMGDARENPQWIFKDKYFSVPVSIKSGRNHEVYIRIQSFNSIMLETRVLTSDELSQQTNYYYFWVGAFYGILIIMALYNLSLAFITRDTAYFVYVSYVLLFCFLALTISGDGYYGIWTGFPQFNSYAIALAGGLLSIPTLLFPYYLLDISKNAPKLRWGFFVLIALSATYLLCIPFMEVNTSLKLINVINLIYMLFLLGVAIYLTVKQVPVAWIYLLAWSFLIAGLMILSLAAYDVIPMNELTYQANLVGGLIEMVLLSIALAQRVRYERQAREKALQKALSAQAKAAESQLRFDELFRQAPVGIFQAKRNGEILAANPAMQDFLGYSSEQEIKDNYLDVYRRFNGAGKLGARIFKENAIIDYETKYHSNGEDFDCSVTMRAGRVGNEDIVEGYITDISERKKAQQIHDMMEKERIASVGHLVTGVAHEINTPLGINVTSLSHFKELLEEVDTAMESNSLTKTHFKNFVEDMGSITQMMDVNLKHIATLVDRFKALSISQLDVEKAYTDMHEQLHAIMAGQFTLDESVHYEVICHPDAFIETYPGAWHIIISQLVENSIMHGFEDKKDKQISLELHQLNIDHWRFIYRDNGCGISQEVYENIFEPFFTTRRGNKSNAGLGMYRVFNIVKQVLKADIELLQGDGFALQIDFRELTVDR